MAIVYNCAHTWCEAWREGSRGKCCMWQTKCDQDYKIPIHEIGTILFQALLPFTVSFTEFSY